VEAPSTSLTLRERMVLDNPGKIWDYYDWESKSLGEGGYGVVCRAQCKKTGLEFALKTIHKKTDQLSLLRNEIDITKAMDHPTVVKLAASFEDHRNIYLVMELCRGGELFDRIVDAGHFTEQQAAILVRQMCRSLCYIHASGVCHRDLKPENFLFLDKGPLEDSQLKLVDFGLAKRFSSQQAVFTTCLGTPAYVAPEVLSGSYSVECDLWSCGVIVYILLSGGTPFGGNTDKQVIKSVRRGEYSMQGSIWKEISSSAKDLIRKLLCVDPKSRLAASQVLQHKWVVDGVPAAANSERGLCLVENLRSFCSQGFFKKAARTVIAGQLKHHQIKDLKAAFEALDTDADGTISLREIHDALEKMDLNIPHDLHKIMQDLDSKGSGRIEYTDFIAGALDERVYGCEEVCWNAFKFFDRDDDGTISQDELKILLAQQELQELPGMRKLADIVHEIDVDGDGRIQFSEFMRMMTKADGGP